MSWKLVEKPKTLRVTKALAKQFADMEPAPYDRPLSERRLQVYQRLFAQGAFRPVTWATATCKETGGTYRVNGKHTSTLLSGLEQLPEFYVTVEEYTCETLEDVARLYATFDSKVMSRTARDINASFAATVPELVGVSRRVIDLSVAGIAYHLWMDGSSNHQLAERAELLLEHPEFVLWLQELVGQPGGQVATRLSCKHLMRSSVVAAMFGTWRKSHAGASTFWAAVRDETGSDPSVPDRKLARFLLQTGVDNGSGSKRVRKADGREFYVKSLHAWNAWRKGEKTDLRYYSDVNPPSIR